MINRLAMTIFFRSDYNINICNSLVLSYLINNWDHVLFVYAKRMVAFLGNWIWQANVHTFSGMIALAGNLLPTILFFAGQHCRRGERIVSPGLGSMADRAGRGSVLRHDIY